MSGSPGSRGDDRFGALIQPTFALSFMVIVTLVTGWEELNYWAKGKKAQAKVIRGERTQSESGAYRVEYTFVDESTGRERKETGIFSEGSYHLASAPFTRFTVEYLPGEYGKSRLPGTGTRAFWLLGFVGLIIFLAVRIVLILNRSGGSSTPPQAVPDRMRRPREEPKRWEATPGDRSGTAGPAMCPFCKIVLTRSEAAGSSCPSCQKPFN